VNGASPLIVKLDAVPAFGVIVRPLRETGEPFDVRLTFELVKLDATIDFEKFTGTELTGAFKLPDTGPTEATAGNVVSTFTLKNVIKGLNWCVVRFSSTSPIVSLVLFDGRLIAAE
jgi:hypothetical protein